MKPSAFGQANKTDPCPFRLGIRIKPQAHTRPNPRTFQLNLCCVYAFLWRFLRNSCAKASENFNKCLAVCIIVAESACHCDEFDKSKFCNLPKITCLNVVVLKFSSQSIILLFIKRHTTNIPCLTFPDVSANVCTSDRILKKDCKYSSACGKSPFPGQTCAAHKSAPNGALSPDIS